MNFIGLIGTLTLFGITTLASARGFELEIERVALSGPGAQLVDLSDRRVKDVDDIDGWRANARWMISDRWAVRAGFERLDTKYESPLGGGCPLSIGNLYGLTFCQHVLTPRSGTIEDKVESLEVALVHAAPLTDALDLAFEVGYKASEWRSRDDIEALTVTRCERLPGEGFAGIPVAGCSVIDAKADDSGFIAVGRIDWAITTRLSLKSSLHYQDYRYVIYRYDVIERFEQTNCDTAPHCDDILPDVSRDIDDGSWTWAQVRAEYALSPNWTLYVGGEGGGSRDWNGAFAGARFSW